MYYDYFGLSEAPFSIAPNPEYLFMTDRHQEALAHLYHSVESDAGFVLLTGDVGTGKTTICRSFLEKLPKDTEVAFILNPFLSGRELLMMICQELSIKDQAENASLRQLTNAIYSHLLNNHSVGKQTVLLIDEAQHLHFKVLELIRLLTNLETDTHKLLKIVLVGQPELNDTLAKPELSQLSQRITARYHIKPLSQQETSAYIDYRLRMAGYLSEKKIFSLGIIKRIFSETGGVPRLINVICDRALLGTYSQNVAEVNETILSKAVLEVKGEAYANKKNRSKIWFYGLISLAVILLLLCVYLLVFRDHVNDRTDSANQADHQMDDRSNIELINDNAKENTDQKGVVLREQLKSSSSSLLHINQDVNAENQISNKLSLSKTDQIQYFVNFESAFTSLISNIAAKTSRLSNSINTNCNTISSLGWNCQRHSVANWNEFKRINRPAVISLVNIVGESYFLPVVSITSDTVEVITPRGNERLFLSSLTNEWTGEVVYLWQAPKGFNKVIYFDSPPELVDWLANAFSAIDNRTEKLASVSFNSLLKKRIILFQRENGLVEDGIAGVETLLKINEKLGVAITLNHLN